MPGDALNTTNDSRRAAVTAPCINPSRLVAGLPLCPQKPGIDVHALSTKQDGRRAPEYGWCLNVGWCSPSCFGVGMGFT